MEHTEKTFQPNLVIVFRFFVPIQCLRPKTCHAFLTIFVRKNDNIFALQSIVIVVFLVLSIRSDKKLLLKENIALISMQTLISNIINILHSWYPTLGLFLHSAY